MKRKTYVTHSWLHSAVSNSARISASMIPRLFLQNSLDTAEGLNIAIPLTEYVMKIWYSDILCFVMIRYVTDAIHILQHYYSGTEIIVSVKLVYRQIYSHVHSGRGFLSLRAPGITWIIVDKVHQLSIVFLGTIGERPQSKGYIALIARFMAPTWGLPGADRTQVGPM